MMRAIVRVPATTANLGPGFDCLGAALSLYNKVEVIRGAKAQPDTMIDATADIFFQRAQKRPFRFGWNITGEVPRARGLGSSVIVRLGILHGLNALTQKPLTKDALYRLCTELEGHPDNAAPGAFGGFVVARRNGDYLRCPIDPRWKFILWIPDFEVSTPKARKVLPKQIDRLHAVESVGNAAMLTAGFFTNNIDKLRGAFADYLHQPYRETLIPKMDAVLQAAVEAGAVGAWLSGSGSVLAALANKRSMQIAQAMKKAGGRPDVLLRVVGPENKGTHVRVVS